jgi:hypothetical protein
MMLLRRRGPDRREDTRRRPGLAPALDQLEPDSAVWACWSGWTAGRLRRVGALDVTHFVTHLAGRGVG